VATPDSRTDRRYGHGREDQRDEFARDRDRILYSTALRRLAGITQVVAAAEGHVFHNRLTHTLEVAQLARRLAESLKKDNELAMAVGGVEPEVTEAAGLAHDLGHPPFGHIAEEVLDDRITNALKIDDGFEGNAQTFRVVTKLSVRYREHPGQDLTPATMNAILKYPWHRGVAGYRRKKYGAYKTEKEDFDWARAVQPEAATEQKSAEAEIMDWADDIAYAVHDMEDFYRAGFIPLDRLLDDVPDGSEAADEVENFTQGTFSRWEQGFRPVRDPHTNEQLRDAFLNLIEQLRETHQVTESSYSGSLAQRANLRGLTSTLIRRYVGELTLRAPTLDDSRLVHIRQEADREITMLKQLTWFYVIQRSSLAGQQYGQRRVIGDLFDIFYEATTRERAMLPPAAVENFQIEVEEGHTSENSLRARMAADIVCSLSEQQAISLHQRFTGIDPGSILLGMMP
jgi:dGTPase